MEPKINKQQREQSCRLHPRKGTADEWNKANVGDMKNLFNKYAALSLSRFFGGQEA